MLTEDNITIGIIGLGYVGLPLATAFEKFFPVVGYDNSKNRIAQLNQSVDSTGEVSFETLQNSAIKFTSDKNDLKAVNFYIVCVPTPITAKNIPDLEMLKSASKLVGEVIRKGDVVVFESTVYPGTTEEVCIPVISNTSGLSCIFDEDFGFYSVAKQYGVDGFHCGYSPERINPGDKCRTIDKIVKVTSGSSDYSSEFIDKVYKKIITAGTFRASSIAVAEASKVIENTQRDLNIALMNELSIIFDRMGLDTEEVLQAAETKWNFLAFRPGLVGGHCIGVDPYYLTYKSQSLGYNPEIILAGRKLNDDMARIAAVKILSGLTAKGQITDKAKVLVCGFSFKENCPDIRNSKVADLHSILLDKGCMVDVYDPVVSRFQVEDQYGINLVSAPISRCYDAVVIAVAHTEFIAKGAGFFRSLLSQDGILVDLKYAFSKDESDLRL
ncbi:nucleotide sugar dehydrogenase [Pseudomonadales bacterium]|nr:nucleotide sugar dehydrogenase [Pseudomonadales bacterium]